MLMSPNKDETAVHGCHCPGDMAVRMRKVLATPRGWCMSVSLAFFVFLIWWEPGADPGGNYETQHKTSLNRHCTCATSANPQPGVRLKKRKNSNS